MRENVLPVVVPPITLNQLRIKVDEMAGKEEIVLRRHGHGVAHEGARVEAQGSREGSRDTMEMSDQKPPRIWKKQRNLRSFRGIYISGSFFMSAIAAKGMPKLDAGPQKSGCEASVSIGHSSTRHDLRSCMQVF